MNKNLKNLITTIKTPMKLKTLLQSFDALNVLVQKEGIGMVTQAKLIPIYKRVKNELDDFTENKNKKVKELGREQLNEKGEPTGRYEVKPENSEKFEKELKELLDSDIEVDVPEITYSELTNGNEKFSLPTSVLIDLEWLIRLDINK